MVDAARALSFGADAELYDRMRPRYPGALFDDVIGGQRLRVVDVGCGTGIAAEAFLARGCEVLGVEPDERMAALASRKGIPVEVAAFEHWDPRGRRFDIVSSAQAWHWVDQATGWDRAASVLDPGGRLALFWNLGSHDATTQAALDAVYDRHAPQLRKDSVPLGTVRKGLGVSQARSVRGSGLFAEPEVLTYRWSQRHSSEEWAASLPTHSDHRALPPDTLAALVDGVRDAIEELGGEIELDYRTVAVVAVRA